MARLKLSAIEDEKPVKMTIDLPAGLYRDLVDYAALLSAERGQAKSDARRLIAPMLKRFIATDREFQRWRNRPRDNPPHQTAIED